MAQHLFCLPFHCAFPAGTSAPSDHMILEEMSVPRLSPALHTGLPMTSCLCYQCPPLQAMECATNNDSNNKDSSLPIVRKKSGGPKSLSLVQLFISSKTQIFTILLVLLCLVVALWRRDGCSGCCIMNASKSKDARIFLLAGLTFIKERRH